MSESSVVVWCENIASEVVVAAGTTLEQMLDSLSLEDRDLIISAYVNNSSKDLNHRIYEPLSVRFINRGHFEGARVYARTMCMVLHKAVSDIMPGSRLLIKQSVKSGYYFEITDRQVTHADALAIKQRMEQLIASPMPITREKVPYKKAIEIFKREGLEDKADLITSRPKLYVTINRLADICGYFYGTLAISTAYLSLFDITPLGEGYHLALPKRENPTELDLMLNTDKMFGLFTKHKRWGEIVDISTISKLNSAIESGQISEIVRMGEALQENEFFHLAKKIAVAKQSGVQLVLISGPSSSGKTTSSKRLMVQLRVLGLHPIALSIDDYFINRADTPLDENGKPDYESLRAIDTTSFSCDINRLMAGESVEVPRYDFSSGTRQRGETITLTENSILIVEGIHALNPKMSEQIAPEKKYKVYASALTAISMDSHSRIGTTDNRLLRRMVRDHNYRGSSALKTLSGWGSVRRGEERNIFPYQEEADYMFNTALIYELAALKPYASPLLKSVPDTTEEYSEAQRLLRMLEYVSSLDGRHIPPTSIIREFIGGSSFDY